jgi:cell division septum initiation protein DivIVA
VEVAVKQQQQQQQSSKKPSSSSSVTSVTMTEISSRLLDNGGFYYGIDPKTLGSYTSTSSDKKTKQRPPKLKDSMYEALEELRILRQEMERMNKELHSLKLKMMGEEDEESLILQPESMSDEAKAQARMMRRKKQKEAEKLAREIESWAQRLLQEGEEEGWKEVECNKMMRGTVNESGRTTVYMKWMQDSRADKANKADTSDYPCIKCYSTIDAPLEDVCTYLSEEAASADYNDVVDKHKDVEEISPGAKICWSQSPQILFIKPRDFVTFCHHRWKSDGTEVIVNQACDHPDFPLEEMEKEGKSCRGYALRGANCK